MSSAGRSGPAPIVKRAAACTLDFLVVFAWLALLLGIGVGVLRIIGSDGERTVSPVVMDLVAFCLTVLPVSVWFAVQEGGPKQATWGKRRVGIRVEAAAGGPLGMRRALVRSIVKFAPWQIAHTSLFHVPGWPFQPEDPGVVVMSGLIGSQALVVVYVLVAVVTRRHRTPYDVVSGAIVVR
jgi:uncharacterized RDD family membrane protein YckC